jgi:hypothetical protein
MADDQNKDDRPFVERWLEEQKEWQKTMLTYVDTMANNEDFLVHLGNAMRGSLLAGKPYPGTVPGTASGSAAGAESDSADKNAAADDRLDRILFTLHELQGQLNDLQLTVDQLVAAKADSDPTATAAAPIQFGSTSETPAHQQSQPMPASDRERDED